MNSPSRPSVSFVIPLYHSESSIAAVIEDIARLSVEGGHELILVNDGSTDRTSEVVERAAAAAKIPVTLVEHTRNYGEHNAVLTGWRHARGEWVINLDDDGQNPPSEGLKLWQAAQAAGWDVAYGTYREKRHSAWRNAGSWFTNRMTDWALDKPVGLYLSSFRCVRRVVVEEVVRNAGPTPYLDGLILQVTQRIGSVEVEHRARAAGESSYTLRKLVRLSLSSVVNFSVAPLRLAIVLGAALGVAGLVAIIAVAYLWHTNQGPAFGWGSLMAALLFFSGIQLCVLGVIGEYLGRMFLIAQQRPQSAVRQIRLWRTGQ